MCIKAAILPFAQVATQVLHNLGGDYASLAELQPFEFTVATLTQRRQGLFQLQKQWVIQRQQGSNYQFIEVLGENLILEMVVIPEGTFLMGSPKQERDRSNNEELQHEVVVSSFFMGKYPITQAQWRFVASLPQVNHFLKPDPSHFKGDKRPVECVSWYDAVEFCQRLSQHTHRTYRLPSEAEWEYACRAGTRTPFSFGQTITAELANYCATITYGDGAKGEYRQETTPVDHFGIANAFGLCDMHGNVWEWCLDHWHESYKGAPNDGSAWLTDDEGAALTDDGNAYRVQRGGSWDSIPRACRCASRNFTFPGYDYDLFGFRAVCEFPRILQ
jgi:formylglycine-generating enzyme required for sulfatase activity